MVNSAVSSQLVILVFVNSYFWWVLDQITSLGNQFLKCDGPEPFLAWYFECLLQILLWILLSWCIVRITRALTGVLLTHQFWFPPKETNMTQIWDFETLNSLKIDEGTMHYGVFLELDLENERKYLAIGWWKLDSTWQPLFLQDSTWHVQLISFPY